MQNRYVGDVGDFGKHGLLRFLNGATGPSAWAGFPPRRYVVSHARQTHARGMAINRDGDHLTYLCRTRRESKSEYRDCDPELWEGLRDLVLRDARCVHCVQEEQVLPPDTLYHATILEYQRGSNRDARRQARQLWWDGAMTATQDADLIMMDPDNGTGDPAAMYQAEGPKFMYLPDLSAVWNAGKSLVTYQHIHRIGEAADQIRASAKPSGTLWKVLTPSRSCSIAARRGCSL